MDQNGGAGVLTGAEVMAMGRRTIDLPSGRGKVVVGALGPDVLTEALEGVPDLSTLAPARQEDAATTARRPETKAALSRMAAATVTLVRRGVIEPELFDLRKDGPTALDFTLEDRLAIVKAVLEVSGFTKEAAGEVLPLSRTAS